MRYLLVLMMFLTGCNHYAEFEPLAGSTPDQFENDKESCRTFAHVSYGSTEIVDQDTYIKCMTDLGYVEINK